MQPSKSFSLSRMWEGLMACLIVAFLVAITPFWPLPSTASATTTAPIRTLPRLELTAAKSQVAAPAPKISPLASISPDDARLWNATNPVAVVANTPAAPFVLQTRGLMDRVRAINCLTAAIYYEAGNEGADGQRAVAQVVVNRLRDPAYPKTVCGVVFEGSTRTTGCQFTFTCDGSLARAPSAAGWERARLVAQAVLDGDVDNAVGRATHYHADYVAPYWSPSLQKVATVGTHIFYRSPGGRLDAAYAGQEAEQPGAPPTDLSIADAQTAPVAAVEAVAPVEVAAAQIATAAEEVETPAAIAESVKIEAPYRDGQGQRAPLALPRS